MGKYLKLFNTHTEYEAYSRGEMILPNVSYCEDVNDVHYNPYVHDYSQDYLTFVAKADGTFQLSTNAVNYSLDNGETWTELAAATASPTVTTGNKIMWKATGLTPTLSAGIGTFNSTGQFDVEGNPMSLLYGDDFKGQTSLTGKDNYFRFLFNGCTNVVSAKNMSLPATTLGNNCYGGMFNHCTSLTTAPALPATTLGNSCYSGMFEGCTSLTTAPELPATTLTSACYQYMFQGCTSLTTAPALPATTLAGSCYSGMFQGCTSLTTAPELPATTAANYCYDSMFEGCTSLTTAPVLPATTLARNCYSGMFQGCTSLTTAPVLPATTLEQSCYFGMFNGCTSLITAPELLATTLANYCYNGMFEGCTSLNYIKAMFTTTPSSSYTNSWVSGVASSGTFVKNSAAAWNVTGVNGIPSGWTVETASA